MFIKGSTKQYTTLLCPRTDVTALKMWLDQALDHLRLLLNISFYLTLAMTYEVGTSIIPLSDKYVI